jgi:leader peptidase (prepilin peptidase)/N-methyltransferase
VTPPVVAAVAAAGVLAAGWVRAQVFIHSVAPQQPCRTACPRCQHPVITSRHAYAWTPRSLCPHCHDRIGPRAAIVDATTAGAAALLPWTATDPLVLVAFLVFAVAGTALAFVDLAVHRLPDRLTLPVFAAVATLLAVDAIWHHRLANGIGAMAGAAASAACHLLLAIITGGGAGDIKLALGAPASSSAGTAGRPSRSACCWGSPSPHYAQPQWC